MRKIKTIRLIAIPILIIWLIIASLGQDEPTGAGYYQDVTMIQNELKISTITYLTAMNGLKFKITFPEDLEGFARMTIEHVIDPAIEEIENGLLEMENPSGTIDWLNEVRVEIEESLIFVKTMDISNKEDLEILEQYHDALEQLINQS
jgi:hypothetical protein